MEEIIINLKNEKRQKQNVGLLWNVSVKKKEGFLNKFSFIKNHLKVKRNVRLSIENLMIDEKLVCDDEKLLSVVHEGKEYSQSELPVDITLTSLSNPFSLFVNQAAILDSTEMEQRQPHPYSISFEMVLRDEEGAKIDFCSEELSVKFVPLNVQPKVDILLNNASIQYDSQLDYVEVGSVRVAVDEKYRRTPNLQVTLNLSLHDEAGREVSNVVFFENNKNSIEKRLQPSSDSGGFVDLPLFFLFSNISNPLNKIAQYNVTVSPVFSMEYSPEIKHPLPPKMNTIGVLKDLQGTELKVQVTNEVMGTSQYTESSVEYNTHRISFVPQARMMSQIVVDIMNLATDSSNRKAGLLIKNISLSESTRNGVVVFDEAKREIKSGLIRIEGDRYDEMSSEFGCFIANGADAKASLRISFSPAKIADLSQPNGGYEFLFESLLTFDYWENKDGLDIANVPPKTFKLPIVWNLFLEPYPEWLCVDYGSSAIVCKYNNEVIDLKTQKDKIYRRDYRQFREDELENGTKFLSSDIVLHTIDQLDMSSLCTEQSTEEPAPYNSLAICLSPTSSLIKQDVRTQLPCLKILVGNTFLPEKADYVTFQYHRLNAFGRVEKVRANDTRSEEGCVLRVSSVFKESYQALFRYFISPVTGESRHLNKLVLTYPNTYTPVHLNVLRHIANSTFPYLRNGYLKFVSESDAVAAYYIDHWSEFNPGRSIKKAETVLVFDMGAGTLDVTLFDKFTNSSGKLEVKVKGKLGTGKAGNYLDFILARIICEYLGLATADIASTDNVNSVAVLQERLKMKQFIKSTVKTNLTSENAFVYNDGQISADVILNHPEFVAFLDDVTTGILAQLKSYMGEETLKIDTVIMSGRSCKLEVLRRALQASVDELCTGKKHFVDFDGDGQSDRQKIVVVEGAMAQVNKFERANSDVKIRSRRLYASYGLVYQIMGGSYRYVELLNHRDVPFMEDTGTKDFDTINVPGTSVASEIKLIQTYLSTEETERCYNEGKLEFISVMEEHDMTNFNSPSSLRAKLRLDNNNNISVYINGMVSEGCAPKGVDLNSEITKRSIWPVTI